MVWLSRRLWRAGLGGSLGTALVCMVGGAALGAIGGLALSAPGGDSAAVEILYPTFGLCVVVTTVVLWSVAGHAVTIRSAELDLLAGAGATRAQLARLVVIDALSIGAAAGVVGGLLSFAMVFPLAAFLVAGSYLDAGFTATIHPVVVVSSALICALLAAVGSISAVAAAVRGPDRRPPGRLASALAAARIVVGLLAVAGAAAGFVALSRDDTLAGLQRGLACAALLTLGLALIAPLVLRAGTASVLLAARGGCEVALVAGAEVRASRQHAPVIASIIATVLVTFVLAAGTTSEAAGRAGLLAGLQGASVVTDAGEPLIPQEMATLEDDLGAGARRSTAVGRTSATWLPDGEQATAWPVGVVDPHRLRETWQGGLTGDLSDFAASGTAVVSRSDALVYEIGATLRFRTTSGVMALRVVATVASAGPWGILVSPKDGARLEAPTGYDVLTTDAAVAGAAVEQGWQVLPASTWVAAMSVQDLTGGAGSGDVGVVTAIPILSCVSLAVASTAMAHTRRARQRRVMNLAGANRAQIALLDQLQALLPVLIGLGAALGASLIAVAASQANASNRIGAEITSQFPWLVMALIAAAFTVPTAAITAAQSATGSPRHET